MGLLIYDALVLAKVIATIPDCKRVLTLGVPTLNFRAKDFVQHLTGRPDLLQGVPIPGEFDDHQGFFRGLGCERIESLDISGYEGANIIGDLNDPKLPEQIHQRYDLIYDSGTIEHIFDAPTALRSLAALVRVGGAVVHATPSNGFMDHGLWQVSPDLFRAFYRNAGFDILTSALFVFDDEPHAVRADINFYRMHGRKFVAEKFSEAIAVFAAVKRADVHSIRVRLQDYYQSMHDGGAADRASEFFVEFDGRRPRSLARGLIGRMKQKYMALRQSTSSASR